MSTTRHRDIIANFYRQHESFAKKYIGFEIFNKNKIPNLKWQSEILARPVSLSAICYEYISVTPTFVPPQQETVDAQKYATAWISHICELLTLLEEVKYAHRSSEIFNDDVEEMISCATDVAMLWVQAHCAALCLGYR